MSVDAEPTAALDPAGSDGAAPATVPAPRRSERVVARVTRTKERLDSSQRRSRAAPVRAGRSGEPGHDPGGPGLDPAAARAGDPGRPAAARRRRRAARERQRAPGPEPRRDRTTCSGCSPPVTRCAARGPCSARCSPCCPPTPGRRRCSAAYEIAWGVTSRGWRGLWRPLVWLTAFVAVGAVVIALPPRAHAGRALADAAAPGGLGAGRVRLEPGGRSTSCSRGAVGWRLLLPGAVALTLGLLGLRAAAAVYLSTAIVHNYASTGRSGSSSCC